jgi:hypothetical protein
MLASGKQETKPGEFNVVPTLAVHVSSHAYPSLVRPFQVLLLAMVS